MNESPLKSWDRYVRTARVYMELTARGCCTCQNSPWASPNAKSPGSLVSERPKPYLDWLAQSRWGSQLPAPARPTQSSEPTFFRSYGSGLPTSLEATVYTLPPDFQGSAKHRTLLQTQRSPIQSVSGKPTPYKEKTTLPRAPATTLLFSCLFFFFFFFFFWWVGWLLVGGGGGGTYPCFWSWWDGPRGACTCSSSPFTGI